MRNQRGITLVALVVTIIVLLILAGVSLSLVMGNQGILNQATTAVETDKVARAKEEVELLFAEKITEYYKAKYTGDKTEDAANELAYLAESITSTGITTNSGYTVTMTEPASKKSTITVSGNGLTTAITGTVSEKGAITWTNS